MKTFINTFTILTVLAFVALCLYVNGYRVIGPVSKAELKAQQDLLAAFDPESQPTVWAAVDEVRP